MTQYTKTIEKRAVDLVFHARKNRSIHPEGTFDKAGRWQPSAAEDADDFTLTVRSPSRAWPYSYMVAARTKKHIKALFEVSPEYVLGIATKLDLDFAVKVKDHRAMEAKAAQRRAEKRAKLIAADEELNGAMLNAFPS